LEKAGRHLSTSDLEELLHSILSDRTVELGHLRHNWLDALDVFSGNRPVKGKVLLDQLQRLSAAPISSQWVKRGLVCFDAATMLECRACNKEETRRRVIHLSVDTARQNGNDLLCCNVEDFVEAAGGTGEIDMGSGQLFVAPMVELPPGNATLSGMGMALIHTIFLLAGPRPEEMRLFTHQVYSMLSANGVAAGLGHFPDLINDYLWRESMAVHSQVNYLFPRALVLLTPGRFCIS
jgi:hypothetical protein